MNNKAKIITAIVLTSIFGFVSPATAAEAPTAPVSAPIEIASISGGAGSLAG